MRPILVTPTEDLFECIRKQWIGPVVFTLVENEPDFIQVVLAAAKELHHGLHGDGCCQFKRILEKQRSWSDCHGDVETRFSKDDLLTTIMIYWVTQSYGTSARYYYEAAHHPWTPVHDRMPVVEAPVGISVLPEEICSAPRRWAQRYYNLKQWRHHASGGHFAAWEEPQAIITDIRDFFRVLS